MKEHIYYHWKKILGDVLIALLLLLATKIPDLVFDRMFSSISSDMAVIFAAQYFLICLSWFVLLAFTASRIPKILSGEYRE